VIDRARRGTIDVVEILAAATLLSRGSTAQKIEAMFDLFSDKMQQLSVITMNMVVDTCLSGIFRVFDVGLRKEDLAKARNACWSVVNPQIQGGYFTQADFETWAWSTPEVYVFCSFSFTASARLPMLSAVRLADTQKLLDRPPSADIVIDGSEPKRRLLSISSSLVPWPWVSFLLLSSDTPAHQC
jgi:hypothetical protein